MLLLAFSFRTCTVPKFGAADVAQQSGSIPAGLIPTHAFPGNLAAGEPLRQLPDCLQNRVEWYYFGSNTTTLCRIILHIDSELGECETNVADFIGI